MNANAEPPVRFPQLEVVQPPASNGTAASIAAYNRYLDERKAIRLLRHEVLEALKISVGPIIVESLSDAITGAFTLDIGGLYQYIRHEFGQPNATEVAAWKADMRAPCELATIMGITKYASKIREAVANLQFANQSVSEVDKMDAFRLGTRGHPDISDIVNDYRKANPALHNQKLDAMIAFVLLHIPNKADTLLDLGYSSAAPIGKEFAASAIVSTTTKTELEALKEQMAELKQIIMRQDSRGFKRGGGRNGGHKATGRGRGQEQRQEYCFRHGYGSHVGTACREMKHNSDFTETMKAAKNPSSVSGGSTVGQM